MTEKEKTNTKPEYGYEQTWPSVKRPGGRPKQTALGAIPFRIISITIKKKKVVFGFRD